MPEEKKSHQPTNKVVSFEEAYYQTTRKVSDPKIASLAKELNLKSSCRTNGSSNRPTPTEAQSSSSQSQRSSSTPPRRTRNSRKESERKMLKEFKSMLIIAVILYIIAMIAKGFIPTSGVPQVIVFIVNILFTAATICVFGALIYYLVWRYKFYKKYSE